MDEALEQALRALRRREHSVAEIDRYLQTRGVGEEERSGVVETLVRTSLVDDRRYAEARASTLAERGAGDDVIRRQLVASGVDSDVVSEAIAALPSERERAERIVARRGAGATTGRYLARKGFSDDVVHDAIARSHGETLG